jgi:hypothetical protein
VHLVYISIRKKRDLTATMQYVLQYSVCFKSQPDDDPIGSKHVAV